jgi:hypothetical protein
MTMAWKPEDYELMKTMSLGWFLEMLNPQPPEQVAKFLALILGHARVFYDNEGDSVASIALTIAETIIDEYAEGLAINEDVADDVVLHMERLAWHLNGEARQDWKPEILDRLRTIHGDHSYNATEEAGE